MGIVAVVGLGYVGLPLAVEFGKKRKTIGFDLSTNKIENYKRYIDPTGEVSTEQLKTAVNLTVTLDPADLADADYIVVAVPTPVDIAHNPDFTPLLGASETVGKHMKRGAIVVYESTVYPGATEEVCIPVLEKYSGMKWKQDFHVGFSPERINPGDKEHTLTSILKVVSGDDHVTLEKVAGLYESIVTAGVHRASSIMVAVTLSNARFSTELSPSIFDPGGPISGIAPTISTVRAIDRAIRGIIRQRTRCRSHSSMMRSI